MKHHFTFSYEQKSILERMRLPYDYIDVEEEHLVDIEEHVADYMLAHFVGDNGELTKDGLVCESILDVVTKY